MRREVPERNKVPGLSYAFSDDGLELPVVDVTHPAFSGDPVDLDALVEKSLRTIERSARLPRPLIALMARRSIIVRGPLAAKGSVGPELLGGGYAGWIDRRLAAALSPVCIRRRLRDVARMLADAIVPALADRRRPLVLLSIAGGTAIDSLNALLVLRRQRPELLEGRAVAIRVLDLDPAAPAFGARALEALRGPGGVLQGVEATFELRLHDWNDLDGLRRQLGELDPAAALAVASEGGLFEYGSDASIAGNLAVLREAAPPDAVVVGSYMRDARPGQVISRNAAAANRLFDEAAFGTLTERAGWHAVRRAGGNPMYEVVQLAPR